MMSKHFLSYIFSVAILISCIGAISLTNFQLVQVNAVFFNATASTNAPARLFAKYYPIAGENADTLTLRSTATDLGTSHTIFFSRLYANTTYQFDIYVKATKTKIHSGQFNTTALPAAIRDHVITVTGTPDIDELILVNLPDFTGAGNNYIYKWNHKGKIVWYLKDASPLSIGFGLNEDADENILYADATDRLNAYAPWGSVIKTKTTDGCPDFHHEAFLEENGRYLWALNINLLNDGVHPGVQADETFVRWDTKLNTIEVVVNVSSFVSTNIRTPLSDLPFFGYVPCKNPSVPGLSDWLHGNSLRRSKHHKKFMVYSSRSLSSVFIFDRHLQTLLYTVGGSTSDFTFPNSNAHFTTQHTADILDTNNPQILKLLVFDNGVENAVPYNRGLLVRLDLVTMEVSKIWDYRLSVNPNCLGNFTGSAYELDNGEFLINFPTCVWDFSVPNTAYIVHLDKNGVEKWRYAQFKPNQSFNYRAYESASIAGEFIV